MTNHRGRRAVRIVTVATFLYFSVGAGLLPLEKVQQRECLPAALEWELHNDYPSSLRWIPRQTTSWCMAGPPVVVFGDQRRGPLPVPPPGDVQLSFVRVRRDLPFFLPYFAATTEGKWHFRIGARWNPLEGYYTFPSFTLKKLH